jgi:hypothetical protein
VAFSLVYFIQKLAFYNSVVHKDFCHVDSSRLTPLLSVTGVPQPRPMSLLSHSIEGLNVT